jgi:hypothetical protein
MAEGVGLPSAMLVCATRLDVLLAKLAPAFKPDACGRGSRSYPQTPSPQPGNTGLG